MVGLALENVPDALGRLPDDAVIDTFNSTMGQKWPAAKPFIDGIFGKKGHLLHAHGHNLAAAPLPGAGFRVLHDDVKSLMQSIKAPMPTIISPTAPSPPQRNMYVPYVSLSCASVSQITVASISRSRGVHASSVVKSIKRLAID